MIRAPEHLQSAAKFYTVYSSDTAKDHDLRISHVAIDRKHTTAEDPATYFPLTELRRTAADRPDRICCPAVSRPSDQSQPSRDARCQTARRSSLDARPMGSMQRSSFPTAPSAIRASVLLRERWRRTVSPPSSWAVPRTSSNMSAYHAFCSLTSRSARVGSPGDRVSQAFSLDLALSILQAAPAPRTTVQSPLVWSVNPDWKLDYCNIAQPLPRRDQAATRGI